MRIYMNIFFLVIMYVMFCIVVCEYMTYGNNICNVLYCSQLKTKYVGLTNSLSTRY